MVFQLNMLSFYNMNVMDIHIMEIISLCHHIARGEKCMGAPKSKKGYEDAMEYYIVLQLLCLAIGSYGSSIKQLTNIAASS